MGDPYPNEPTIKTEEISKNQRIPRQIRSNAFKCEFCDEKFNLKDHLIRHVTEVHKSALTTVKLEPPISESISTLSHNHIANQKNSIDHPIQQNNKIKFKCNICKKLFANRSTLMTHKVSHSDKRPFECNLCEKTFKSQADLKMHHRIHSDEIQFVCKLCGKSFKFQGGLTEHELEMRRDERMVLCSTCGIKALSDLESDKQRDSTVQLFECKLCGKLFKYQSNLTRHDRSHTGMRDMQCDL
eukprot:223678_1